MVHDNKITLLVPFPQTIFQACQSASRAQFSFNCIWDQGGDLGQSVVLYFTLRRRIVVSMLFSLVLVCLFDHKLTPQAFGISYLAGFAYHPSDVVFWQAPLFTGSELLISWWTVSVLLSQISSFSPVFKCYLGLKCFSAFLSLSSVTWPFMFSL